ncbi:hypothetical protein HPB50_024786 [Hyalomma asiaticum]|uniref:Uncharacterized protein n=1 Tax=Hyalomma asiaticum TaxID=266040 RepID=A0ACB7TFH8_HYAAI|nr:hypothetical protein HPB50_024786 [Hyalomma asiaticum]
MLAGPPQAVDGPVVATGTPSPMAMATTATPSSTVPAISIAPSGPKSTKDDEPGLTYAMPAPTVTASQDVREPETTEEAPVVTPYKKKPLDAQPLLCTYGAETNTTTLFPGDGLCDLIFYDSAYKHNRDIPNVPSSFSESMNAVLSHSSNYKATEIGIGFTYE